MLKMTEYKIKYDHPNHLNITTYFKHQKMTWLLKKAAHIPIDKLSTSNFFGIRFAS
jgi:hypothetical protein